VKIKELGKNLFEVRISWWKWSYKKELAKALKKIQEDGKTVTAISKFGYVYLICTSEKV
jgi:hypothetical protein